MPRSAAQPEELTLQGNLFGSPDPTKKPAATAATARVTAELEDLSDASLSADAAARPRQRQINATDQLEPSSNESENDDDSGAPTWSHHSEVDQTLLTPMLRHYVELKAEHPDRVLLYRSTRSGCSALSST